MRELIQRGSGWLVAGALALTLGLGAATASADEVEYYDIRIELLADRHYVVSRQDVRDALENIGFRVVDVDTYHRSIVVESRERPRRTQVTRALDDLDIRAVGVVRIEPPVHVRN